MKERISLTINRNDLKKVDDLIDGKEIRSRSHIFEMAIDLFLKEREKNDKNKRQ